MKKLNKLLLVIVCIFAFTISVVAEENYDYNDSKTVYSLEDVAEQQLLQGDAAKAFSDNLGACKSLSYETKVEEGTDEFDTITVETSREKDQKVEEKEEEGYTVVVVEEKHEAAILEYAFNVLNGEIVSTTLNGNNINGYEGRKADQVIDSPEFTDYEDDDVVVENTVTVDFHDVSGTQTFATNSAAHNYEQELLSVGYRPEVNQNNTTPTVTTLRTMFEFNSNMRNMYQNMISYQNPNKEILDFDMSYEIKTETATFDNERAANNDAQRKRFSFQYSNVDVEKEIDTNNPSITTANEFDWTNPTTESYTQNVEDNDGDVVGYRYFYTEEVIEENAQEEINVPNNGNDYVYDQRTRTSASILCERAKSYYGDEWTTECRQNGTQGGHRKFTLIATKPAVTRTQGYYDEYLYPVSYNVIARYYLYTISYVATDYTVNYTGDEGTVNIVKSSADKFYTINGSRPEYTVKTLGTINEDTACLNTGKTVGTGVSSNIYYELIALLSISALATIFFLRKRHN